MARAPDASAPKLRRRADRRDVSSMKASGLDDAAFSAGERVKDDERSGVDVSNARSHFPDLEPHHDAIENVLLGTAHRTVTFIYGDAAAKVPCYALADCGIQIGNDRDGRVLVDPVEHEIECLRR